MRFIVEGELQKAVAAVEIQLVADIQPVVFNGLDADAEQFCDLLAGAVLCNELEDAPLGSGQFVNLGSAQE